MSQEPARRTSGYVLVAAAASGWGTWPLILKHAVMPASLQSALVMTVMTLGSLPWMLRDRIRARATRKQWLGIAWLGVGDALNIALFFAAYQRTSVAIAVLTHYLTPVFVALVAPLVVQERASVRTFIAVGIAFIGLALLLEPWRGTLSHADVVGAGLGAGSAVFYASNVVVQKRLALVFSGSELMFFHGLVSVPLLVAFVPAGAFAQVSGASVAIVLAGAVGPGTMGGLFFVWGLRRIAASHASVLTLLEPLVAVILAAVALGERLGPVPILGAAAIVTGAALVVIGKRHEDEVGFEA